MKIDIEKAFEKWFKAGYARDLQPHNLSDEGKRQAFQAAYSLMRDELMPIIEKQQEALEFYGDPENYLMTAGKSIQSEIYDDDESIPDGCGCVPVCRCPSYAGKRARQTLKQVEDELKSLTDTSLHSEKIGAEDYRKVPEATGGEE